LLLTALKPLKTRYKNSCMEIERIIHETNNAAKQYGLAFDVIDITEHIVNLKLTIDREFFIKIYANETKDKINLALVFKMRRLYGYDREGINAHIHPFENPDKHIFISETKSIHEFIFESLQYLEEQEIL
jgi:hypothetical protein